MSDEDQGWKHHLALKTPDYEAFFDAVESNNLVGVQNAVIQLLDLDASYRARNITPYQGGPWFPCEVTPLHVAAARGFTDIVSILLRNGASPNSREDDEETSGSVSRTPLHCAVDQFHIDVVNLLLEHGADINAIGAEDRTAIDELFARPSGNTLLPEALEMMKLLLSKGHDPEISANTSLLISALEFNNRIEVIQTLLDHGASLHSSPVLQCAIHYGDLDLIKYLMGRGAIVTPDTINSVYSSVEIMTHLLSQADAETIALSRPFFYPVSFGSIHLIDFLVASGFDIDALNNQGETPLLRECGAQEPNIIGVQTLLKYGADVSKGAPTLARRNNQGPVDERSSPLHRCVHGGYTAIIEALLDGGGDINALNTNGQTPLFTHLLRLWSPLPRVSLPENPRLSNIKLLVKHGADTNAVDSRGRSLLYAVAMSAAKTFYPVDAAIAAAKMLIDAGVDTDARSLAGHTAFDCFAKSGQDNIIEILSSYINERKLIHGEQ